MKTVSTEIAADRRKEHEPYNLTSINNIDSKTNKAHMSKLQTRFKSPEYVGFR